MLNTMSRYVRTVNNRIEWVKIVNITPHLPYILYKGLFSDEIKAVSRYEFTSQFKEVI